MAYHKRWNIALLSLSPSIYSTRRIAEEGRKRGHTLHVLDYLRCYMTMGTHKMQMHYGDRTITGYHAIIPRIGTSNTYYGSTVIRQFEAIHTVTLVSSYGLVHSRDKLMCQQILAEAGVRVPLTAFAQGMHDIEHAIEIVGGGPVVIKVLKGTQGIGVVMAETVMAARSIMEAFRSLDTHAVVQKYYEDAQGKDIRALVIGGKVVASMERTAVEGEFRANVHRGASTKATELSKEEELTAVRVAGLFGLDVVGVDMLRSEEGPLVIDVNSSPGLGGIENATQVNIAEHIVDLVETRCVERFGGIK